MSIDVTHLLTYISDSVEYVDKKQMTTKALQLNTKQICSGSDSDTPSHD